MTIWILFNWNRILINSKQYIPKIIHPQWNWLKPSMTANKVKTFCAVTGKKLDLHRFLGKLNKAQNEKQVHLTEQCKVDNSLKSPLLTQDRYWNQCLPPPRKKYQSCSYFLYPQYRYIYSFISFSAFVNFVHLDSQKEQKKDVLSTTSP